jgi:2-hydroxychromene-2-carboxylate isomerase
MSQPQAEEIEFWFDFRSPYSYLAHTQLAGLGAPVALKPMYVLQVMEIVGNTPTTITCEVKGRYARADLGRWAALYGVPLSGHPKMRALDGRRLMRAALAAIEAGHGEAAVKALFEAVWVNGAPLDSAEDVAALLAGAGFAIEPAALDAPELDARLDAAAREAAERGVFGAPTFITGGQMFFGNDRLDFLKSHLKAAA